MLSNVALVALLLCQANAAVYMIMEYNTDGTVVLNHANFTVHTVSINVTLLGCDYGYYDHYLLYPPPTASPKYQTTPFDCRPCTCTEFESMRVEEFVVGTSG
jgi:hypothetical protein